MANCNKLNRTQKEVMAKFMAAHPDLAKNLLLNCTKSKSTANKLWEDLTKQLNSVGPPIKDIKLWKKVFADQKYQTKKKLSLKRSSMRQPGWPFQEKLLTPAEELLVEAAGLEACVEGNKFAENIKTRSQESYSSKNDDEASSSELDSPISSVPDCSRLKSCASPKRMHSKDTKMAMLEQNMKLVAEHQQLMCAKFDRLIEISERQLQIKERQLKIKEKELHIKKEKHKFLMSSKEVQLKIKYLESLERNLGK